MLKSLIIAQARKGLKLHFMQTGIFFPKINNRVGPNKIVQGGKWTKVK